MIGLIQFLLNYISDGSNVTNSEPLRNINLYYINYKESSYQKNINNIPMDEKLCKYSEKLSWYSDYFLAYWTNIKTGPIVFINSVELKVSPSEYMQI